MRNPFGPFHFDLNKPNSWRDGASNLGEWQAWDRTWRKRLGWRAGLAIWSKTNTPGSRVLISRHWPHRLCWSWSIWVGISRQLYDGLPKIALVISRRHRSIDVRLWRVKVHVNSQDSGYMAALGPNGEGAPKIYWKHHLEHAEALGSA